MNKQSKHGEDRTPGKNDRPAGASAAAARKPFPTGARAARNLVRKKDEPWTEAASFVINFERRTTAAGQAERRITAHRMQDGGITAEWTRLAQQPLAQWISDHVGSDWGDVELEPAPPASALLPTEPAKAPVTLHNTGIFGVAIGAVEARQPDGAATGTRGKSTAGKDAGTALRSGMAFDLDAVVNIDADGDRQLPASVLCAVQFFCRNVVTHERMSLGEVPVNAQLADPTSYRARLPGVTLQAGTYRVTTVAFVKSKPPKLAYTQDLLLEVA